MLSNDTINQKKLKPKENENNDGKINFEKFQSNPWLIFPKKEKALISHSLEPTKSHFLKIDHISKIEQYLKKIIEENIRANISQKIEY